MEYFCLTEYEYSTCFVILPDDSVPTFGFLLTSVIVVALFDGLFLLQTSPWLNHSRKACLMVQDFLNEAVIRREQFFLL